jgi:flagella basal body P-ring formation protein FlgA
MFKLEDSVTCGESVDVLAGGGWSLAVTAEGTACEDGRLGGKGSQ